jgi:hypothetical protein
MLLICARVLAILSVALYLVPTAAHLFVLPHKLALSPADYMMVQGIYRGWSLFGIVAAVAVLSTLLYAIMRWRRPLVRNLSLIAFLCFATTQVIFWTFTYPMNVASNNWTTLPDHFDAARRQWEYSHAASAALTFLALLAIGLAVALDDGAPQYRSSGAHA